MMRGHIRKRGNGYTIILSLGLDPATGKRVRKWISVQGNKKDAERKLSELLREIDTGAFVLPGKVSVADFLKSWLEEYARPNLGGRTYEGYSDIVANRLIPAFGSVTLTRLTPEHIQKAYSGWLKDGRLDGGGALSPNSVRRYHQCLHRALETAVKRGLVARNVAAATGTGYHDLYFLALYTGMRRSELLGLKWSDIDLVLGQISVSRSLHHLRDGSTDIRPPKTAKGKRLIALSPDASLMLQDYRKRRGTLFSELGRPLKDNDYVFSDKSGGPLLPDRVTRSWVRLMHHLGVPDAPFHCLRHTHASLMLKAGVHPKIVQERLGHSSIRITLDIYSHIAPGLQEEAAKAFDRTLSTLLEEVADRRNG